MLPTPRGTTPKVENLGLSKIIIEILWIDICGNYQLASKKFTEIYLQSGD